MPGTCTDEERIRNGQGCGRPEERKDRRKPRVFLRPKAEEIFDHILATKFIKLPDNPNLPPAEE